MSQICVVCVQNWWLGMRYNKSSWNTSSQKDIRFYKRIVLFYLTKYNKTMELILFWLWFLFMLSLAQAWLWFAPWMPTNMKDLERIDKIVDLQPWQAFLEFWCGTARVCTYVARQYPESEVVWIEYAFPFFVYSWIKQKLLWPKNLKIIFANGFTYPLDSFDVIYTFGMTRSINQKLKKKLLEEMKSWAKFVSYVFKIEDREWWSIVHHEWNKTYSWVYVFTKS